MAKTIDADVDTIHAAFDTLENALTAFHAEESASPLCAQLSQLFQESESVRSQIMAYLKNGNLNAAHALYLSDYRVSLNNIITSSGELKTMISTAGESAAANQELSGQAAMLSSMVDRFRLRTNR